MSTSSESRPSILIVKDDQAVLEMLVDLLEPEGYKVVAADSARRALELTSVYGPDLIISDVVMPEMSGLALCHDLKTSPATSSIPVMMVSAVRKEVAALIHG